MDPVVFFDNMLLLHTWRHLPLAEHGANLCWLLGLHDAPAQAVQDVVDYALCDLSGHLGAVQMTPDENLEALAELPDFGPPDTLAGAVELLRTLGREVERYPHKFGHSGAKEDWRNLIVSDEQIGKLVALAARSLVRRAHQGDVQAAKAILDRIDGAVEQTIHVRRDELSDLSDAQLETLIEDLKAVEAGQRGMEHDAHDG